MIHMAAVFFYEEFKSVAHLGVKLRTIKGIINVV